MIETIDFSTQINLPLKLKLAKFNRPNPELLNSSMLFYHELVSWKLRNLKPAVTILCRTCNNLNPDLRIALKQLINMVKNKIIVICKADKDGKIINSFRFFRLFYLSISIINRKFKTFTLCSDINKNNVYKYFHEIRQHNDSLMTEII